MVTGMRVALLTGVLLAASLAEACCFSGHEPTLLERAQQADVVSLAVIVDAWPGVGRDDPGYALFEIHQIGRDKQGLAKTGLRVGASFDYASLSSDSALLFGYKANDGGLTWVAEPSSPATLPYLLNAPSDERPATERLAYHLKYLESSEGTIAALAAAELSNGSLDDYRSIRDRLSRPQLLSLLKKPDVDGWTRATYFQLLAFCGQVEDAALMKQAIFAMTPEESGGMGQTIAALLALTGEAGLEDLERQFLDDPKATIEQQVALLDALQSIDSLTTPLVPQARIRKTFVRMLNCPMVASAAVDALTYGADWSVAAKVRSLFPMTMPVKKSRDESEYEEETCRCETLRSSVIRYFAAFRDEEHGQHVKDALVHIRALRRIDPERVAEFDPEVESPALPLSF